MDGEIASKEIERKRGSLMKSASISGGTVQVLKKSRQGKVADYLKEKAFGQRGEQEVPTAIKALWKWASGDWIYGEFDALLTEPESFFQERRNSGTDIRLTMWTQPALYGTCRSCHWAERRDDSKIFRTILFLPVRVKNFF